jgi:hypothetical protein
MLAVLPLAALLLGPLLGCDQPRRYSRSSGYYGDEYSDVQFTGAELAAQMDRKKPGRLVSGLFYAFQVVRRAF